MYTLNIVIIRAYLPKGTYNRTPVFLPKVNICNYSVTMGIYLPYVLGVVINVCRLYDHRLKEYRTIKILHI